MLSVFDITFGRVRVWGRSFAMRVFLARVWAGQLNRKWGMVSGVVTAFRSWSWSSWQCWQLLA